MSSVDIFIEKEYAVISSFEEDASDFVSKVNELMQRGWIISGGISSSNNIYANTTNQVSKKQTYVILSKSRFRPFR